MNIPYVMKKCSKCGCWLVANTVNFHRMKAGKYGLNSKCKECRNKDNKQYHKANREKIAERQKQYRDNNKEKEAERHKRYYEANKDKIDERHKQYYEANKDKIAEQRKQYRENNKGRIAEYGKQYRKANKEKIVEYREANKDKIAEINKRYREANKDKIAEYKKQWSKQYYQTPQGQVARFNGRQRRRTREEQQGTGITKDQWLEMMSFFDWRCAYSGEYLGGNDNSFNRTIDHIVPLDAGGDHEIWNLVPMTRSLNSSKCANNMEEWYKEQECYDPNRLQKIYEWQEYAFNKYYLEEEY